jgi:hypothetical protein
MNLRLAVLAVALLSIAATGEPCNGGDSTGTSDGAAAGENGAVCGGVSLDVPCCVAVGESCDGDNNNCCTGTCSGSNGEAGFLSEGSTCAEPANEGCTAALSSRCNTGMCECASDDDCCIGSCAAATIPGTSGKRCCLETGSPCDANADCCSLTCEDSGQCE